MRQLELTYPASYIGHRAWRGDDDDRIGGALELLNAALEHLGRKDAIFELNVAKSTLSEAERETNDKRWAAEWIFKVLAMLTLRADEKSAQLQLAILQSIVVLTPRFAIVDATEELTDEEIAVTKRVAEKASKRKRAA